MSTGRGPFQSPAEAVANWLDGASTEGIQRVTTPGTGKKPFAWNLLKTANQLGGTPAKLVLPLDFPAHPAEVHVHKDLCLTLPHVEETGKVCLGTPSKPGDYSSPAHAVADTLRDFETQFLEKIPEFSWVHNEFQRECLAYWARYCEAYKRRRGFPAPKVVQIALRQFKGWAEGTLAGYTHGEKTQRSHLWLATMGNEDANALAHRHGWAKGTMQRGHTLFVEMPKEVDWTPKAWPETLEELDQRIAEWSEHEFSLISWIEGKWDRKPHPYLIVLVQGTVAFGFCLAPPVVPGLTSLGLVPVLIERIDPDWALARDHELDALHGRRQTKVLLLGCGSLGAPVAELLARAGIGRLSLVDMEHFEPENAARHVLGYTSLNQSKAPELAAKLRKELPGIDVKGHHAFASSWLAHQVRAGDFDVVLDCTGESSVRSMVAELVPKHLGPLDVAHLWMEPFCAAAHAVYIASGDSWPANDPADSHVNVVDWPTDVQVKLPACGAGFHPYGAADVWQVAGFCVERLLAHIDGQVTQSMVWTWTRGTAYLDTLNVDAVAGPLVPKTGSRFDVSTLERPFKELFGG